jgi:hypothetical protein
MNRMLLSFSSFHNTQTRDEARNIESSSDALDRVKLPLSSKTNVLSAQSQPAFFHELGRMDLIERRDILAWRTSRAAGVLASESRNIETPKSASSGGR